MWKYVPPEIVKKAKEIDLLTYFMNKRPSELVRKGSNTYSLKQHDSLIINNGMWHRFSTNEAGTTALNYLMKVENMNFQDAINEVLEGNYSTTINYSNNEEKDLKTIVIPQKANDNKQVIDYLINRGIDEEIINYCINNNLIYQEEKTNNVVFVGYDNDKNIKYAGCRSTNEKRIMRDAKGSSKEFSFRLLSKNKSNSLHVFESSIDLLSYATLLKLKGKDYHEYNLLALSGVYQPSSNIEQSKVPIAIQKYLEKNNYIEDIILHLDNDKAGRDATKALIIALNKYNVYDIPATKGKDINDYLCLKLGLKKEFYNKKKGKDNGTRIYYKY